MQNPFGPIGDEHTEIINRISNFFLYLTVSVIQIMEHEGLDSYEWQSVWSRLAAQADEVMNTIIEAKKAEYFGVDDLYKIVFYMKEQTFPLMVELEQLADENNMDIRTTNMLNPSTFMKPSEYIIERICSFK